MFFFWFLLAGGKEGERGRGRGRGRCWHEAEYLWWVLLPEISAIASHIERGALNAGMEELELSGRKLGDMVFAPMRKPIASSPWKPLLTCLKYNMAILLKVLLLFSYIGWVLTR